MSPELAWFFLFIFLGFTTEVATGFGSIVIALSLGTLVLPIDAMLPVLVSLNAIMNGVLLCRLWKQVHVATLFKLILPLMLLGMLLGISLLPQLQDELLKKGFALLVLWFVIRELYKLYRHIQSSAKGMYWQYGWTFMAGITHGLYASGGPLLVYALSRTQLDKAQFRATLLATWFALNASYTMILWQQQILPAYATQIIYGLPILALSILLGQYLHKRINELYFKKIVYFLLALSSIAMLV